jgi:hypothetical protein
MMDALRRYSLLLLLAAVGAGGCASAGAKSQPTSSPLEVPTPPARVVVPAEPPPPPQPATDDPGARTIQDTAGKTAARAPARPAPVAKKDVVETPPPSDPAKPPTVAAPGPTLEQPLPPKPEEIERDVREKLKKAESDLNKVDYQALNPDGKAQYDTAKRFMKEAQQALAQKNFVFALKVADKAAGLAAGLPAR